KKTIGQNDQLKEIFTGVDLEALSKNLQMLTKQQEKEELTPQEPETISEPKENPLSGYAAPQPPRPKPEVFLGDDPLAQKERVFAYFEEKPKAKELLMSDVDRFKELLASRPDVQPIFENVNINKLSEKLNQAKEDDAHD
ncbi:MAG: hypothetical protein KC535_04375, partial [Nanoarchaeota archaeon]|nr:hypothetical protein [Nanoarchaeota archaeon]